MRSARITALKRRLKEVSRMGGEKDGSKSLEILPGTPYSKFAIPLEYMPSRKMEPRWGYSHEPEPVLNAWFGEHEEKYRAFLGKMRENAPGLADIPHTFDEKHLPEPAWAGVPYAPFDGLALYSMINEHKPKTYLEIGSGISTCFAYKGVRDFKTNTRIVSIDPEPRTKIDAICDEVVRDGLETCDVEMFSALEAGDILFFDGSHRTYMNSDVTVFMIDVLPRLKPGVIVHVHDVFLPYDYPHMFVPWYWSEQYMLAVYMMGNRRRINPLLPTQFICRDERFTADLAEPMIEIGDMNPGWKGGGAMWFTHTDKF